MKTSSKYLCRIVSFLGFACAVFCLWYIGTVAFGVIGSPPQDDMPSRFTEWYVGLSLAAALIAIGAAIGSFDLARLRIRGVRILTICSLLPLPLIMILGMSWLLPMGTSIGAATGVGVGGLMPMLFSLLPVWSGLLWVFAFRSQADPQPTTT